MRTIVNINRKWAFSKEATAVPAGIDSKWNFVNLPHSWNAIDGQDGGSDYYRGTAWYARELDKEELPEAERYYIEINGANSSADLYVGGEKLAHHDGGYSTWRVDITDKLKQKTLLALAVDNAPNDRVYPQVADFTFYGGLYRDINIVCVPASHFDLDYYGGPGIMVTPVVDGVNANVEVQTFVTNSKMGQTVRYTFYDQAENAIGSVESAEGKVNYTIENVRLWNGRKDPYLYCVEAELIEDGKVLDSV